MGSFARISKDNEGKYKLVTFIENPERIERVEFELVNQVWVQLDRKVKLEEK